MNKDYSKLIVFDSKNKKLMVSKEVFDYKDIQGAQIVYEDAFYKGKSPMFSHKILVSTFPNGLFIALKKVFVGIEIKINNSKKYIYISSEPVIQHNYQFKQDVEIAEKITKKLKQISKNHKQI